MCPSSPSAWPIWSWADPFPSLSKKLFYFVKKGLLQTAPKRDRRSRKGPPISFFALYSLRCRPAGMGTAIPPHASLPQIGCPRSGLFAGRHPEQQELFCAKILEACRAQDCRLSRQPEEVLNIMRNAPAKPLRTGRKQPFFLCIACPAALTCCAITCISGNGKFFVIPHRPPSQSKKRPDKSRVRPEGHTLPVYLYLTMCAETGTKRPQNAETTR